LERKKFIFVGALLHGGNHYTTIIKCPNAYLHYDGMGKQKKFRFYPLSKSKEAMNSRAISHYLYQVVDEETEMVDDVEWDSVVEAENRYIDMEEGKACTKSATKPQTNVLDIEAGLKELQQAIGKKVKLNKKRDVTVGRKREPTTHMAEKQTKTPSQQKRIKLGFSMRTTVSKEPHTHMAEKQTTTPSPQKRIKLGFSVRTTVPKRGKKATCQACKCSIEYDVLCIRYGFFARQSNTYPQVYQYHGTVACLKKMERNHLSVFMDKYWTHPDVAHLQHEMKKQDAAV
jgi:hypothetical protein